VRKLFVAWQDPPTRSWFLIGRLTVENGTYRFQYVRGAQEAEDKGGLQPFGVFPELHRTYDSDELFPIFAKRVLSPSRPEYSDFVGWLGLTGADIDPVELLARSGGQSVTDRLEIFPFPEKTGENNYHSHFFAHGLRHLSEAAVDRINCLKAQERLYLANEFQNPQDPKAMLLCTEDHWIVGYCPRYLLHDVEDPAADPEKLVITVEQDVSPETPLQFKLLCRMTAAWDESELPFNKTQYQPIGKPAPYSTNKGTENEAVLIREKDS
jgi:hypothetical protein